MKLYHYAPKENTCLQKGILSVSLLPECLFHYTSRAGSEKHSGAEAVRFLVLPSL